jgi:exopolyphosphatase/guanosine-5'-triphosphate,3'-diphosphate pyrophosphatase
VSERFFHHDPPRHGELTEARAFVRDVLSRAEVKLPKLAAGGVVVGLAGTVSTLAMLEARIDQYDRALVHHAVLERDRVASWLETLANEDRAARLVRPGMVRGREDVIVGGVLILDAVMDLFDRALCLVSEDDILDGMAAAMRPQRRA